MEIFLHFNMAAGQSGAVGEIAYSAKSALGVKIEKNPVFGCANATGD